MRAGIAGALAAGQWPTRAPPETLHIAGVRVLRHRPGATSRGAVLHLHGGGFRAGCPDMDGPFAESLAARCQVDVYCVAYRLAPEHPFPAGLLDTWAVLRELTADDSAGPVALSGASAGAALATGAALLAAAAGIPVAALLQYSPWLDLAVSAAAYERNAAKDRLFSASAAREAAAWYLQGESSTQPLASPLCAELGGLPPTFIAVGSGEVLIDDSRRLQAALRSLGRSVELVEVPGMEHIAVVRDPRAAGVAGVFAALAAFIDRSFDGAAAGRAATRAATRQV